MRSYEAYLVHEKKHQTQQRESNHLHKTNQNQSNRERPKNYARISQKDNDSD